MRGGLIEIISVSESDDASEARVKLSVQNEHGSEDILLLIRYDLLSCTELDISTLPCVINEEQAELLNQTSEQTRAIRSAYRSVSCSPCTRKMLIYKLIGKGFARETAEFAADFVDGKGYIDEEAYAVRECEKCLHKLWGRHRILSHLKSRGCSESAMEKARKYLENSDFELTCCDFLTKKYRTYPASEVQLRKMYSGAIQYGYSGDEIKKALLLMKQKQK